MPSCPHIRMRFLDLSIVALYLVGITLFGARFRRRQSTLKDYFLGGRTAPWWAIALSIVSAETSTLTIIGTPALAFQGNLGFLQIVLGYLLARIVISFVISIILGTGEVASIVLIVGLTLFYTFEGGMTAVIWTDVIQMTLYVVGAALSFVVILQKIPGGWEHVAAVASPLGKLQVFDFHFAFTRGFFRNTYTFWAGIAGGCLLA